MLRSLFAAVIAIAFIAFTGCASRRCFCPSTSRPMTGFDPRFADINGEGGSLWTTDGLFDSHDGGRTWRRVERRPTLSTELIDAATIPPTPPGEDVVRHLGRFHTGDEETIQGISDRLSGKIDRPWAVERLAAAFAAALESKQRADLVYLLAASKDPMGLRVAGNSLDHEELDTRVAAATGIERYWIEVKNSGNLEMIMDSAKSFWEGKRAMIEQKR